MGDSARTTTNTTRQLQDYAAFLRDIMKREIAHPEHPDAPLTGLKVVVNPGNGGGGFIAEQACGGCPGGAGTIVQNHQEAASASVLPVPCASPTPACPAVPGCAAGAGPTGRRRHRQHSSGAWWVAAWPGDLLACPNGVPATAGTKDRP